MKPLLSRGFTRFQPRNFGLERVPTELGDASGAVRAAQIDIQAVVRPLEVQQGPVGGQFLSRARRTSHTISPTRTRNSTPIPSHPSEPIPFPKPPIMVNSSFIHPLRPGFVQCRARVPCSR